MKIILFFTSERQGFDTEIVGHEEDATEGDKSYGHSFTAHISAC